MQRFEETYNQCTQRKIVNNQTDVDTDNSNEKTPGLYSLYLDYTPMQSISMRFIQLYCIIA